MKSYKVYFVVIIFIIAASKDSYSFSQYDSLKIKISQMLIFGIQDAKKVLEEDSLLEAYSNTHLGGIILFEKNISKKRSKVHLKALIDEIQNVSKIPSLKV